MAILVRIVYCFQNLYLKKKQQNVDVFGRMEFVWGFWFTYSLFHFPFLTFREATSNSIYPSSSPSVIYNILRVSGMHNIPRVSDDLFLSKTMATQKNRSLTFSDSSIDLNNTLKCNKLPKMKYYYYLFTFIAA